MRLSPRLQLPGGPVAFTIDWPAVELVWSNDGYPSAPEYLEYHRLSGEGSRLVVDLRRALRPGGGARARRAPTPARSSAAVRERLERYTEETGRRGLCVFAIDTELLGHWWSEGPWWLEELVAAAERRRGRRGC